MKAFDIYDPLHDRKVGIFLCEYDMFLDVAKQYWVNIDDLEEEPLWLTFEEEQLIRLSKPDISLIVHELTHLVLFMGQKMWYEFVWGSEYYAYSMEYFTKQVIEKLGLHTKSDTMKKGTKKGKWGKKC